MKANGAFWEAQVVCSALHLEFQSKGKIRGIKRRSEKRICLLPTANKTLSIISFNAADQSASVFHNRVALADCGADGEYPPPNKKSLHLIFIFPANFLCKYRGGKKGKASHSLLYESSVLFSLHCRESWLNATLCPRAGHRQTGYVF